MKFKIFSIVTGTPACTAKCPFCVSSMLPTRENLKEPEVNWRNFRIAAKLAKQGGVDSVILTSRGEPTLFPNQITKYLDALREFDFPLIELQTNGMLLARKKAQYADYLTDWYNKGLTTVAVSTTHYDPEKNKQIYAPNRDSYFDLPKLVDNLHEVGYSVRLACVAFDGHIDGAKELEKMIDFARYNKVEQLMVRPVNEEPRRPEAQKWIEGRRLKPGQLEEMAKYLANEGTKLLVLPSIGEVYDVRGQNVCLSYPLNQNTRDNDPEKARQLIFFPDGHIRYEWEKEGAVIL